MVVYFVLSDSERRGESYLGEVRTLHWRKKLREMGSPTFSRRLGAVGGVTGSISYN